jgi:hypothetical protein
MKKIYNVLFISILVLYIAPSCYGELSFIPIEFKDSKGNIIKTLNIPLKCTFTYDLDMEQKIFTRGYISDPNMISLSEKHANTDYIFKYLNPKPLLIHKQYYSFCRTTYINGPFYLICDASTKKMNVMLADTKCLEIDIKEIVLPINHEGIFHLRLNTGSRADIHGLAMNLPPLVFEHQSNNSQWYSIYPETIEKDSLMGQYYSSKTKNIIVSNNDYGILLKVLFEKQSFLVWK